MTPHIQDQLYDPTRPEHRGNCWQVVIASVLDLPIEDVPHFVQDDVDHEPDFDWHWLNRTTRWLNERGFSLCYTDFEEAPGEYVLVTGLSPRGNGTIHHVVIYRDGAMVHDPHPDATGLLSVDPNAFVIRQEQA